jgi:WD40 repeat protein
LELYSKAEARQMSEHQFQVGGSLEADASCYVVRSSDEKIYKALKAGEFCYVLNSRQMGKSSILVRTKKRLQEEGFQCVFLDMTRIGSNDITPQQWYYGIITELWMGLNLASKVNLKSWFKEQENISFVQQLSNFIEYIIDTVLSQDKIVIFIDEIDSVLSLNFEVADFFAYIRFCYNNRAVNSEYHRLNFAIFGVSTPSDLITDKNRTPFNIGTAIELNGFQLHEVQSLAEGLKPYVANPQEVIAEILAWTGGQPFLTQKLCRLIEELTPQSSFFIIEELGERAKVADLVREYITQNWESKDEPEHLRTINYRLERNHLYVGRMLGIYQRILQGKHIKVDDSYEQRELILSGLVVKNKGLLQIKNRIYKQVFNLEWISTKLINLRPYSQTLNAWVATNKHDTSRLLRGQALIDSQIWSQGKSLSDLDYQFLAASMEFDRQQAQIGLEAERAKEIAARLDSERQVAKLQRKLLLGFRTATLVTVVLLIITIALSAATWSQYQQSLQSEIKALATSADALFVSNQRLDALLAAIKAKRKSQQVDGVKSDIQNQVESVLQRTVYGVSEYNRFSGDSGAILGVAISPDGQTIATANQEGSVKLWQLDGTLLKTFRGHKTTVFKVKFSPDSKTVASVSLDGTIKLWKLDGTLLQTFLGHQGSVWDVAFSRDGQTIASASADKTVKLWRLNGTNIGTFIHNAGVWGVAFSPDGTTVASSTQNGIVQLRKRDGTLISTLKGHEGAVWDVIFSPDGKTVISSSSDKTIKIWELDGTRLQTINAHNSGVMAISISADGKIIVSASADKTIKLWTKEGNLLSELKQHDAGVWDVAISPNTNVVASAGIDGLVKLWKIRDSLSKTFYGHQATVWDVVFSPDGKTIASASGDSSIKLWKKDVSRVTTLKVKSIEIMGVAFSPDGKTLASGAGNGNINLWKIEEINKGNLVAAKTFKGHLSSILSLVFSPDSQMILSAGDDKTVRLWKQDGTLLHTFQGHKTRVMKAIFSPNGNLIASSSADSTIKLWKRDGTLLSTLNGNNERFWGVAFSPDGGTVASGSSKGNIKIWKTDDGSLIKNIKANKQSFTRIAFSPDGKILAVGTWQNKVQLWKLDGTLLTTLAAGHESTVWSVAFSPDGNYLVSGSDDQKIILWNVKRITNLNLLRYACDWLNDYLRKNPEVEKEDKHLCDNIK